MFFKDEWPADRNLKKTIAGAVVVTLIAGLGGYKLLTTATPVSRETALERFRAQVAGRGDDSKGSGASPRAASRDKGTPDRPAERKEPASTERGSGASGSDTDSDSGETVAAAPAEQAPASNTSERKRSRPQGYTPGRPEEGVYSWDTEGYESFSGSRRQFPSETQRIVTHDGPNEWTLHHYFSEERESWSGVVSDDQGYLIPWQRNRIVFGPVTRDVTLRFDPPLRTGFYPARVGRSWEGSFDGPTHGDYRMRFFDHTTMTIGGTEIEVWAVEMHMTLRGENEGTVLGRFWVDPERHMVVREHYRQNIQTGPGTYRAEWDMTLKSLEPRR